MESTQRKKQILCDVPSHASEALNMICLDPECIDRGIMCAECLVEKHRSHKHKTTTLNSFISRMQIGLEGKVSNTPVSPQKLDNMIDDIIKELDFLKKEFLEKLEHLEAEILKFNKSAQYAMSYSKPKELVDCLKNLEARNFQRRKDADEAINLLLGFAHINDGDIDTMTLSSIPNAVSEQTLRNVFAQKRLDIKQYCLQILASIEKTPNFIFDETDLNTTSSPSRVLDTEFAYSRTLKDSEISIRGEMMRGDRNDVIRNDMIRPEIMRGDTPVKKSYDNDMNVSKYNSKLNSPITLESRSPTRYDARSPSRYEPESSSTISHKSPGQQPERKQTPKKSNIKTIEIYEDGSTCQINTICFMPELEYVVTGNNDGFVKVWDLKNKDPWKVFDVKSKVSSVAATLDEGYILIGTTEGMIACFNINTSKSKYEIYEHKGCVSSLLCIDHQRTLVSGGEDKHIYYWNLENGDPKARIKDAHKAWIWNLKMIGPDRDDGDILYASSSGDMTVCLRKLKKKMITKTFTLDKAFGISLEYVPSTKVLLAGDSTGSITVIDLASGNITQNFKAHEGMVASIKMLRDKDYFVTAGEDKKIKAWRLSDYKCFEEILGHQAKISSLCYLKNNIMASNSWDKKIKVWTFNDITDNFT